MTEISWIQAKDKAYKEQEESVSERSNSSSGDENSDSDDESDDSSEDISQPLVSNKFELLQLNQD